MRYERIGGSGLTVSCIGLGMMSYGDPARLAWALSGDEAGPIVRRAAEAGITFFDTADMYSDGASEQVTGRLLARFFPDRADYVLATKVFYPASPGPNGQGLSRKHIMASIDGSLRRLGTDYVDLYQIHRWDEGTPAEETVAALEDVVRAGKARYLGASTMAAWQFARAQRTAQATGRTPFLSMQARYNLLNREAEPEMIPFCLDQGVGILPYSPLARGLLAGTRERGAAGTAAGTTPRASRDQREYRSADFDVVDQVRAVAAEHSVPPARIALAWLLARPGVTAPLVGATKLRHLDDALAALEITLTGDEARRLEAPYAPHPPGGYT